MGGAVIGLIAAMAATGSTGAGTGQANSDRVTRVYPVIHLVGTRDPRPTGKRLMGLVRDLVAPNTWDTVGGPGSIGWLKSSTQAIVVWDQPLAVHRQVADLLGALHRARRANTQATTRGSRPLGPAYRASPATRKVQAALDRRLTVHFARVPLADVLRFLSTQAGVAITTDPHALHDEGVPPDTTVSIKLTQASLRSVLRLILNPLNLTFVASDNGIRITSQTRVRNALVVRVYPVGDMGPVPVAPAPPGDDDDDDDDDDEGIMGVIPACTAPNSWDFAGGAGMIREFAPARALVVRQTPDVHEHIADLLARLRQARRVNADAAASGQWPHGPVAWQDPGQKKIRAAMGHRVSVRFDKAPLADVAEFFRRNARVNIVLDTLALNEEGIGPDTPVTMALRDVSLGSALRLILDRLHLTLRATGEVVSITSMTKVQGELVLGVYPAADLMIPPGKRAGRRATRRADLPELIESVVAPFSWDACGGPGGVIAFDPTRSLIVAQTLDVHEQIADVLTWLRLARRANAHRPARGSVRIENPAWRAIETKLDQPVSVAIRDAALADAARTLGKSTGLNVVLDTPGLEEAGIAPDAKVSGPIAGPSLREALRRLLDPMDLTFLVRHEVVLVTGKAAAQAVLTTRVYPVADLVSKAAGKTDPVEALCAWLETTVAPKTWDTVGGPGTVCYCEPAGAIVVVQTWGVHAQITETLARRRPAR